MSAGRKVSMVRAKLRPMAKCEYPTCTVLRPDSTRQRAQQHVKNTGHTVRVVIEDVTVYRPIEDGGS